MPALKNKRHEAFAQAQAKGMSASDAYRATYGTNSPNVNVLSSRLALLAKVGQRVIEIQAHAEHATHLTISEKRSFYAQTKRDPRVKMADRLKACKEDSELAGHIKAAGALEVNVSVAMLTEDRRAELMARKRSAIERRLGRQAAQESNGHGNS